MIRDLKSYVCEPWEYAWIIGSGVVFLDGPWYSILMFSTLFSLVFGIVCGCRVGWPANCIAKPMSSSWLHSCCEGLHLMAYRVLLSQILHDYMDLPINYLMIIISMYYVGTLWGYFMWGMLANFGRCKVAAMALICGVTLSIVLALMTGAIAYRRAVTLAGRSYRMWGHTGNRKTRRFVDPAVVKGLTGEWGFYGAFPMDYNRLCLVMVLMGGLGPLHGVAQAMICDLISDERGSMSAAMASGFAYYWIGCPYMGIHIANSSYILFDINGAFYALAILRGIELLCVSESYGWEKPPFTEESPCWLKALYYGAFLWPQGPQNLRDIASHQWTTMQGRNNATAGYITFMQPTQERSRRYFIWWFVFTRLHFPTIVVMWLSVFLTSNVFYMSFFTDLFNWHLSNVDIDWYFLFPVMWPAFVMYHLRIQDCAWFLGVCNGLKGLGEFMSVSRWPTQLFCGDPMNCWRTQYLYSHAVYYNINGDVGNIWYVVWYLFAKSQKRQCCCPYRRLKPDAPVKCCNPCYQGPFVEETGGCPCPCFCASCATDHVFSW